MSASGARRAGGRLATVVVLCGLLLPFGFVLTVGSASAAQSADVAAAAKAKKKSSWKTVRTEKFSGSSLPDKCTPYTSKYTIGDSAWSSKDVKVSGGKLQLKMEKRKVSGKPYATGGLACMGWAQKYGRYEVRAKIPVGKGIDTTIALFPVKAGQGAWTGMELLTPGPASASKSTSATTPATTPTPTPAAAVPESAYVTNGYKTKFDRAQVPGDYSGAFHTYVIEWSPKQVRMTVDGKQIYYSTHSFNGSRWFAIVLSNGDQLTGIPDAATKLPATLQVDQVKISSYTGVPPKPQVVPVVGPSTTPTPTPTAILPSSVAKLPDAVATGKSVSTAKDGPALAGGVWPWLLGGSLIAIVAIASLNYPGSRRARQTAVREAAERQAAGRH